jgi:hypothetical protein
MLSAKKLHKDSQKIADDPHDVTNVFDGAKDVARDSLHLVAYVAVLLWRLLRRLRL